MRLPERARLGVAALVAAGGAVVGGDTIGCASRTEPDVDISAVTPASAYSDTKIPIVITGGPFRPVYDIDIGMGSELTELGAFSALLSPVSGAGSSYPADVITWLSTSELSAVLPAGIDPGTYDFQVRDPRGRLAVQLRGFESLGLDRAPPVVVIDEPVSGTIVNAGAEVPVAFHADDGAGYLATLEWKVSSSDVDLSGTCPFTADLEQQATCRFVFVAPKPSQPGQPVNVTVTARDTAHNAGQAQTTLSLGVAPTVLTFTPFEGPAAGATLVSVTGDNFIAGTQVLVDGVPLSGTGGTLVSATLIQGKTPAHDPGKATITVRTGSTSVDAEGAYTFVGRPEIRAITPGTGPLAGCTPVTIVGKYFREDPLTRIWLGSDTSTGTPLLCPTYVSANRIEGYAPAGAGAVSVFAGDPVGGVGELPLAFTYLDVDTPDGGTDAGTCPCEAGAP